jgi:hypothetical protein
MGKIVVPQVQTQEPGLQPLDPHLPGRPSLMRTHSMYWTLPPTAVHTNPAAAPAGKCNLINEFN